MEQEGGKEEEGESANLEGASEKLAFTSSLAIGYSGPEGLFARGYPDP